MQKITEYSIRLKLVFKNKRVSSITTERFSLS